MNKNIETIKNEFLNRHNKKYKANTIHEIINRVIDMPDDNIIEEMCCETYECDLLSISLDKHFNPIFQYIVSNSQSNEMYELKITKSNNQWSVKSCEKERMKK
jgi:hypothetical protein